MFPCTCCVLLGGFGPILSELFARRSDAFTHMSNSHSCKRTYHRWIVRWFVSCIIRAPHMALHIRCIPTSNSNYNINAFFFHAYACNTLACMLLRCCVNRLSTLIRWSVVRLYTFFIKYSNAVTHTTQMQILVFKHFNLRPQNKKVEILLLKRLKGVTSKPNTSG